MTLLTTVLRAENGLHLRPAAAFVKLAQGFEADIVVSSGSRQANAKSLFKLQLLGLAKGMEVRIEATGKDEDVAVDMLTKFLTALE